MAKIHIYSPADLTSANGKAKGRPVGAALLC